MSSTRVKPEQKKIGYPETRRSRRQLPPAKLGARYGRWELIKSAGRNDSGKNLWHCRCECGTVRVVQEATLKQGSSVSCGCYKAEVFAEFHGRPREKQPRWKGGRRMDQGYVSLYRPEHPACANSSHKYVKEHRLVMEEHLGRYLRPEETVHHINGKRDDNRIENLELWSSSHPPGQRVTDLVNWARELLQLYEPT